ncbi:aspartyl/glutamyl-tRNA amidotransferase subunit A [Bacilli bacterium]|nr:aspartyl/glutamyl-tRNA amidotransferase subunit A [Bacilli bacterium]
MSCSNNLSHITDSEVKGVLNSLSFDYGKKLIEDIKDEVNGYVDYINKTKPLNFNEIYIEANNEKFKINNKEPIKQLNSKIIDLHNDFIDKKTTIKNHVQHTINSLKELNNDKTASLINDNYASAEAIATNLDNDIINHKNDMLYGIPYALKDLIATDNIKTTCGSKLFENFIPDYNASVYQSLLDSNSILTGKSNMDEFAMGGTGLYSSYGDVCNCLDNERIVGGSSSGSANLVASGILPFSIGTDTSDSVRQPASYTGTVGYIGTHGIAPTYGVLPYDSDDDDIGVFSNYVADAAIVAQNISKTEKCNTDFFNNLNYAENGNFAVIKNIDKSLYNDAKNAYTECLDKIKNFGNINYINISDDLLNSLGEIASCCDHNAAYHSFSNLKYFIYGNDTNYNDPNKNEYLKKENINKLAPQVKRRIAAGACLELKKYKKLILEKIENYREE